VATRNETPAVRPGVLGAASIAVLVGACSLTPAIPVYQPQELALLPVTNRGRATGSWANESFTFGPYQVSDVSRTGSTSVGLKVTGVPGVGSVGNDRSRAGYSYTFTAPGGQSRGECSNRLDERDVPWAASEASRIGCRCQGGGLDSEVALQGPNGSWTGQALLHGYPVPMRAFDRFTNGVYSKIPLGFEAKADAVVGAMASARPGKVWLANYLDPVSQAELACLFAGFLLFQTPKSTSF
jgi:hypothetical protein